MDIQIGDLVKIKGRVKEYGDEIEDDAEYIVTFTDHKDFIALKNEYTSMFNISKNEIIEIKRPCQYKTIYKRKEILDKKEKDYLRAVIRPFREKINSISKCGYNCYNQQYIIIKYDEREEMIRLPDFLKDTMYKGMELDREYTLEELGLWVYK